MGREVKLDLTSKEFMKVIVVQVFYIKKLYEDLWLRLNKSGRHTKLLETRKPKLNIAPVDLAKEK